MALDDLDNAPDTEREPEIVPESQRRTIPNQIKCECAAIAKPPCFYCEWGYVT